MVLIIKQLLYVKLGMLFSAKQKEIEPCLWPDHEPHSKHASGNIKHIIFPLYLRPLQTSWSYSQDKKKKEKKRLDNPRGKFQNPAVLHSCWLTKHAHSFNKWPDKPYNMWSHSGATPQTFGTIDIWFRNHACSPSPSSQEKHLYESWGIIILRDHIAAVHSLLRAAQSGQKSCALAGCC